MYSHLFVLHYFLLCKGIKSTLLLLIVIDCRGQHLSLLRVILMQCWICPGTNLLGQYSLFFMKLFEINIVLEK